MTLYARVVDGAVWGDPVELPEEPARCFAPDEAKLYVASPAGVRHGWTYAGGKFAEPAPPGKAAFNAEAVRAACRARIYARVSATTQANLSAYAADLALTGALSAEQEADVATLRAIRAWVNANLVACRAMVAAGAEDEAEWPAWDRAWDALVAGF